MRYRSIICGVVLLLAACSGPAVVSGMALIGELLTTVADVLAPQVKAMQAECGTVGARALDEKTMRETRSECARLNDAWNYVALNARDAEAAKETGDRAAIDMAADDLDQAVRELEGVMPQTREALEATR